MNWKFGLACRGWLVAWGLVLLAGAAQAHPKLEQAARTLYDQPSEVLASLAPLQFAGDSAEDKLHQVHRAVLLCEANYVLGTPHLVQNEVARVNTLLAYVEPSIRAYLQACNAKLVAAKGDTDKALEISNSAIAIADELSDAGALAYAATTRANFLVAKSRYQEALHDLKLARSIVVDQDYRLSPLIYASRFIIELGIANIFYYTRDYKAALSYLDNIELPTTDFTTPRATLTLSRIHFLMALNQKDQVRLLAEQMATQVDLIDSQVYQAFAHNGLARVFLYLEDLPRVLIHARHGLRLFEQENQSAQVGASKLLLGEALLLTGNNQEGLNLLNEAADALQDGQDLNLISQVYTARAKHFARQGEIDRAVAEIERFIDHGNQVREEYQDQALIDARQEIAEETRSSKLRQDDVALQIAIGLAVVLVLLSIVSGTAFWRYARVRTDSQQQDQMLPETIDELIDRIRTHNIQVCIIKVRYPMVEFGELQKYTELTRTLVRDCDFVQSHWMSRMVVYLPFTNVEQAGKCAEELQRLLQQAGMKGDFTHSVRLLNRHDTEQSIAQELENSFNTSPSFEPALP
ncbi:hypothetical protein [Paraferrimonas sedimenticola]|nr:hypothetical protein [Paraferrimonas sedimenticola]